MQQALTLKFRVVSFFMLAISLAATAGYLLTLFYFDRPWLTLALALLLASLLFYLVVRAVSRYTDDIASLEIALFNISDSNFGVSMPEPKLLEMRAVQKLMNQTFGQLRQQRQNIHQKEMLLDKVIESSPLALVLTNQDGRLIFSNSAARHLFNQGRAMEGLSFDELLAGQAAEFAAVVEEKTETLFHLQEEKPTGVEQKSFHYSWGRFALDHREHYLHLFKELTREINRQEVAIWKKTIKVISHELNNSLAPISSLAHSSKILADSGDTERLKRVLSRIEENVMSLHGFIQRYASFARLPLPNKQPLSWPVLVAHLKDHHAVVWNQAWPEWPCLADAQQVQQALVNLLKNAHESGSPEDQIELKINRYQGRTRIDILDAGPGMKAEVMDQALMPFYSTKTLGSGIGLALCQEIAEAHDGILSLQNRPEGGLQVSLFLP